jgi:transcriptional regulator NrdR family protein
VRFASVYKDFQEIGDFERELGLLLQKRETKALPRCTTASCGSRST